MTIGILSRGIRRIPHLDALLGEDTRWLGRAGACQPRTVRAIAGWGRKASAERARALAAKLGKPFIALEDGFLRSLDLAVTGAAPLSMLCDAVGIYYDATQPSAVEDAIRDGNPGAAELADAQRAMALIVRHRLSKYNHAPDVTLPGGRPRVLVIDQTEGDRSVALGGAGPQTFAAMLDAARREHPDAQIVVKTHPDVVADRRRGYLSAIAADPNVTLLATDCSPLGLLAQCDHVYAVTSQMGFEALLLGKPVTCFGLPWYAGWGLTDDRHPGIAGLRERRPAPRSLAQLFAAAYLRCTRYLHPATGRPGTIFDVIDWLAHNKALRGMDRGTWVCAGMSLWKQAVVTPFLRQPGVTLRFARRLRPGDLQRLPADATLVVWGSRQRALRIAAAALGIPLVRVEDGFVRSAGLGSDLHGPLSLAIDGGGIYYDPASGSRLEALLATTVLDSEQQARAERLRDMLVRLRISKYNVGGAFTLHPAAARRRVVLVPGQVEDDASVLAGSPHVRTNLALLQAVRAIRPDAWIVYKPHPDVLAGNRAGRVEQADAARLADQIAVGANISACIAAADEVHTMTSLAGFEALLQGKAVHCHGGPFYAGWGLTVDHFPLPHRTRVLPLATLVYVALCSYPRYRLPGGAGFCTVEDVVAHLHAQTSGAAVQGGSGWTARRWRKLTQLAAALAPGRRAGR